MLTGSLLDDGARGVAQALAGVAVALVVLLFVAVFVALAVLVNTVTGPASGARPVQPTRAVRQTSPPVAVLPLTGSRLVDVARRYLGVPYVFGGSDPAFGLDCSGLVQLVFRQLGISLPRTAQLQYNATTRLTRDQLQPGDLVFFARTYADPNDWITHVGIYVGDGQQINAPTVGQVVSIQPVFSGFWGVHFAGGGRVSVR